VNYELPNIPETYVHRIGRTGRAGATGVAVSFCDFEEKVYLRDIQKLIRKTIPVVKDHPYDSPVMHVSEQSANRQAPSSSARRGNPMARRGRTFSQQRA